MSVRRILVVDDNPLNLKLARLVLQAAGLHAEVATDAGEAMAIVARRPPDAVVVDLQMPGVDGLDLTRMLRGTAATRDVPIVALSASALESDRVRARAAGCDGFVAKPLDTRTFAADLVAMLPGAAA